MSAFNIKNKNFLTLKDFSKDEILYLIDLAIQLKNEKNKGIYKYRLKNKNIAMIFEKTSTRTRCATSVACFDEGAHAEFLGKNDIQMGVKESIKDTARVVGKMFDAILFRGYKQSTVESLAYYAQIPVINGLTDEYHPTQVLADFMTIKECFKKLENLKIVFLGDGINNMANTLIIGCSKLGLNITIACPKCLSPKKELLDYIKNNEKENYGKIQIIEDPKKAVENADVVYTDVWISMGEENTNMADKKNKLLVPYRVDKNLMRMTNKESTIFLHCLPASHEDEKHSAEVTDEVFESKQSYVFEQAENRMHTIKAILIAIIGKK